MRWDQGRAALDRMLDDPELAARLGRAARERVRTHFLGVRHLVRYARLLQGMM